MRDKGKKDRRKAEDNGKISQNEKTWREGHIIRQPKKKIISHISINLIGNIQEYNVGKI